MNNKYLFIFAITVFLVLSISGAGIYLNDEWMVGQQLNQLSQGHQTLYNEGKYGYYSNGTAGYYMTARSNILIYSMALPILSIPAFLLFTALSTEYTRIFIIVFWGLLGFYILNYIKPIISKSITTLLFWGFLALLCYNLTTSTNFIMTGKFTPYEMIPIVFTNILLYGIFSITCFKITEILFAEKFKQLVGWISCIAMTSLMFWSTTLKDHMLIATIIMIICYLHFQYNIEGKIWQRIIKYILVGLTVWIRPEVGIFIALSTIIFDLYYYRPSIKEFIIISTFMAIGAVQLAVNNYISTGNPLSLPFAISAKGNISGNIVSGNIITQLSSVTIKNYDLISQFGISNPIKWIELIFAPTSGALGLIVPLCLFIFSILIYIKYRPVLSNNLKFLLTVGLSSIAYYILYAGIYLGEDGGIIPDLRYFTTAYTVLTLFALSIIPYNLNYKKIFKNIFIYVPIVIIISIFIISIYPPIGETYKTYRMIPHLISTLSIAAMAILLINDENTKPEKWMGRFIPLAITSAFTWQIIIVFVYYTSKAHYYPMFLPITELLYKLLFGV